MNHVEDLTSEQASGDLFESIGAGASKIKDLGQRVRELAKRGGDVKGVRETIQAAMGQQSQELSTIEALLRISDAPALERQMMSELRTFHSLTKALLADAEGQLNTAESALNSEGDKNPSDASSEIL